MAEFINAIGMPIPDIPVGFGGTGQTSFPSNALVVGNGTEPLTSITPGNDGQLLIGSSGGGIPAFASLTSSDGSLSFTGGTNTLDISLSAEFTSVGIDPWHGSIEETASVTVASDGATITLSVEQDGGGDLTAVFSETDRDWETYI